MNTHFTLKELFQLKELVNDFVEKGNSHYVGVLTKICTVIEETKQSELEMQERIDLDHDNWT